MTNDPGDSNDLSRHGHWLKSSFSNANGCCVEVRRAGPMVYVRDSKERARPGFDPSSEPFISVAAEDFEALTTALRAGSGPIATGTLRVEVADSGATLTSTSSGVALEFTNDEWHAFHRGVQSDEFSLDRIPGRE
jgi:hypothetical protein